MCVYRAMPPIVALTSETSKQSHIGASARRGVCGKDPNWLCAERQNRRRVVCEETFQRSERKRRLASPTRLQRTSLLKIPLIFSRSQRKGCESVQLTAKALAADAAMVAPPPTTHALAVALCDSWLVRESETVRVRPSRFFVKFPFYSISKALFMLINIESEYVSCKLRQRKSRSAASSEVEWIAVIARNC